MSLILFFSCNKKESTEPAPTTGTISGTVMNKSGAATVPAAIITTWPPTSSVSSDAKGAYSIKDVDPGNYIVQAIKDTLDPGNVNVTVKAGKTATADIRLGILLANHPPTQPQLISPGNNSEYQTINTKLEWKESSDEDGDKVAYDLYFGKNNPPSLYLHDLDSTNVKISNLDTATVYFWQVVAKDSKGAKTAGDVWQFKTTPNPIPTDGLVAYWPFNGNANDESGNGNKGTVFWAVLTKDRFGNNNCAYSFDGHSYIKVTDTPLFTLATNPFTISIWINLTKIGSYYILGHDEGGGYHKKWIFWFNKSTLGMHERLNGDYWVIKGNWNPDMHKWYHLVLMRKQNTFYIYVNANLLISKEDNRSIPDPNAPFLIGNAEGNSNMFIGSIDDVRFYKRALSSNEIKGLYYESGWGFR